jgi:hypothetical protein
MTQVIIGENEGIESVRRVKLSAIEENCLD